MTSQTETPQHGSSPLAAIQTLQTLLGTENILIDEPMSKHTTFRIGGPADVMVLPRSASQAAGVVKACRENDVPLRFLGLGSNVLVSDAGVRGVVCKLAENLAGVSVDGTTVTAQAGASNESVALAALQEGLGGYEFASGIPGTIGGAAVMNAGAYDGEFSHVCTSVTCITPEGELVQIPAQQAEWGYRHSLMMDKGYLVVEAVLQLEPGSPAEIQARMDDLRQRRASKQPLEMPSAGSTFKRPAGYFAGKLIQDAGCQGLKVGDAQVSTKHAGFVVNCGNATAQDVCDLIAEVQRRVMEHSGVALEPEVRMWGF